MNCGIGELGPVGIPEKGLGKQDIPEDREVTPRGTGAGLYRERELYVLGAAMQAPRGQLRDSIARRREYRLPSCRSRSRRRHCARPGTVGYPPQSKEDPSACPRALLVAQGREAQ